MRVVLFLLMVLGSCTYAQKEQKNKVINPKVDIKVNKEYDKNGNLIKYDSTYSIFWSNVDTTFSDTVFFSLFKDKKQKLFFDIYNLDSIFLRPNLRSNIFEILDHDLFDYDFGFHFDFDIKREMEKIKEIERKILEKHKQFMEEFFEPPLLIPPIEEQKPLEEKSYDKKNIYKNKEKKKGSIEI